MKYLRRLFQSRPFTKLVPDQAMIVSNPGKGQDYINAARAEDGSFAFVYIPTGRPVRIATGRLKGQRLMAYWYNPRTGKSTKIASFTRMEDREFVPSTSGRGNDWVLVLDDRARNFPPPGYQTN